MALRDSMEHWWKMEEDTTADRIDSHGTADLTASESIARATGIFGGSDYGVDLEESDLEYLSHADDASLEFGTGDFSIALWWKRETTVLGTTENVVRKWSPGYVIQFKATNRQIQWYTNDGTTATVLSDNNAIPNDLNWHHLVVTRSGTTGVIWVDGVDKTSSGSTRSGSIDGSGTFYIGSNGSSEEYDGVIDEVGMWSKALASGEVAELYNSGAGLSYEDTAGAPAGTNSNFLAFM